MNRWATDDFVFVIAFLALDRSFIDDRLYFYAQALYLLLQCNHDVSEALRRHRLQSIPPTGWLTVNFDCAASYLAVSIC
jgi:hypothetical protein